MLTFIANIRVLIWIEIVPPTHLNSTHPNTFNHFRITCQKIITCTCSFSTEPSRLHFAAAKYRYVQITFHTFSHFCITCQKIVTCTR